MYKIHIKGSNFILLFVCGQAKGWNTGYLNI